MTPLEQLERKARLWHIERAASAILRYTDGKTFSDFSSDDLLRMATERQLITIGEALRRGLEVDHGLHDVISDTDAIIGCRNQLVHNYPRIDPAQIWAIIEHDLPRLLAEVRLLLGPISA